VLTSPLLLFLLAFFVIPIAFMLQFGGSFAYSSDARFQQISRQPLPIHDRNEAAR
jgi:hypothetical protein